MKSKSSNQNQTTEPATDWTLDQSLRPTAWKEYIGQENIKQNLKILLQAAQERQHPPEHLLFYGPPGLGKTTLAYLIAKELAAQIKVTSGPAIERVGDLASILTNLSPGDILFIDEIHRLNKLIEEVLYPAMESGKLNIVIGKGPGARVIQLDLPPFTLIAATTRIALLSSPLRSRFSGGTFRLDFYTREEIQEIIRRSAKIMGVEIGEAAAKTIASRSRFTPRLANQLLKRCRDLAQIKKKTIDEQIVLAADRKLLLTLIEKFGGGPTGLNTLAAATAEEEATITEVHEPYLIQLGFLDRPPRGRQATPKAYSHLGHQPPINKQEKLI